MHKILAEISMLIVCAFSAFFQKLEKFILALTTFLTTFPQKNDHLATTLSMRLQTFLAFYA